MIGKYVLKLDVRIRDPRIRPAVVGVEDLNELGRCHCRSCLSRQKVAN
jgi:hypothetical protein